MFTVDSAHGGTNWQERNKDFSEDLGQIWRKCGVYYEWGKLKSVLLHRPSREIENISKPSKVLWTDKINPELAREQHDILAELYRSLGVEVHYVCVNENTTLKPNLYFVRDLFTMTPQGAIISRPASIIRAGEECIISNTLSLLNIPILLTAYGNAFLEGPDILLVNSNLAFVGHGLRTNNEGAEIAIKLLKEIGYDEVIKVQTTYGCGHLDGVVSIVSKDLALIYPTRASYVLYESLKRHGFRVLDLPCSKEAEENMAINIVSIESGCVIIPANNPMTKNLLENSKVTCYEANVSELMKGGGSVHCMTGILNREH